eukprot:Nk52_evm13s251 gene=Nk52_evmTU13s251
MKSHYHYLCALGVIIFFAVLCSSGLVLGSQLQAEAVPDVAVFVDQGKEVAPDSINNNREGWELAVSEVGSKDGEKMKLVNNRINSEIPIEFIDTSVEEGSNSDSKNETERANAPVTDAHTEDEKLNSDEEEEEEEGEEEEEEEEEEEVADDGKVPADTDEDEEKDDDTSHTGNSTSTSSRLLDGDKFGDEESGFDILSYQSGADLQAYLNKMGNQPKRPSILKFDSSLGLNIVDGAARANLFDMSPVNVNQNVPLQVIDSDSSLQFQAYEYKSLIKMLSDLATEKEMKTSLSASFKGFSGSAAFSFSKQTRDIISFVKGENVELARVRYRISAFKTRLNTGNLMLSIGVMNAIANLPFLQPDKFTEGSCFNSPSCRKRLNRYFEFFENFGTHYPRTAYYGGEMNFFFKSMNINEKNSKFSQEQMKMCMDVAMEYIKPKTGDDLKSDEKGADGEALKLSDAKVLEEMGDAPDGGNYKRDTLVSMSNFNARGAIEEMLEDKGEDLSDLSLEEQREILGKDASDVIDKDANDRAINQLCTRRVSTPGAFGLRPEDSEAVDKMKTHAIDNSGSKDIGVTKIKRADYMASIGKYTDHEETSDVEAGVNYGSYYNSKKEKNAKRSSERRTVSVLQTLAQSVYTKMHKAKEREWGKSRKRENLAERFKATGVERERRFSLGFSYKDCLGSTSIQSTSSDRTVDDKMVHLSCTGGRHCPEELILAGSENMNMIPNALKTWRESVYENPAFLFTDQMVPIYKLFEESFQFSVMAKPKIVRRKMESMKWALSIYMGLFTPNLNPYHYCSALECLPENILLSSGGNCMCATDECKRDIRTRNVEVGESVAGLYKSPLGVDTKTLKSLHERYRDACGPQQIDDDNEGCMRLSPMRQDCKDNTHVDFKNSAYGSAVMQKFDALRMEREWLKRVVEPEIAGKYTRRGGGRTYSGFTLSAEQMKENEVRLEKVNKEYAAMSSQIENHRFIVQEVNGNRCVAECEPEDEFKIVYDYHDVCVQWKTICRTQWFFFFKKRYCNTFCGSFKNVQNTQDRSNQWCAPRCKFNAVYYLRPEYKDASDYESHSYDPSSGYKAEVDAYNIEFINRDGDGPYYCLDECPPNRPYVVDKRGHKVCSDKCPDMQYSIATTMGRTCIADCKFNFDVSLFLKRGSKGVRDYGNNRECLWNRVVGMYKLQIRRLNRNSVSCDSSTSAMEGSDSEGYIAFNSDGVMYATPNETLASKVVVTALNMRDIKEILEHKSGLDLDEMASSLQSKGVENWDEEILAKIENQYQEDDINLNGLADEHVRKTIRTRFGDVLYQYLKFSPSFTECNDSDESSSDDTLGLFKQDSVINVLFDEQTLRPVILDSITGEYRLAKSGDFPQAFIPRQEYFHCDRRQERGGACRDLRNFYSTNADGAYNSWLNRNNPYFAKEMFLNVTGSFYPSFSVRENGEVAIPENAISDVFVLNFIPDQTQRFEATFHAQCRENAHVIGDFAPRGMLVGLVNFPEFPYPEFLSSYIITFPTGALKDYSTKGVMQSFTQNGWNNVDMGKEIRFARLSSVRYGLGLVTLASKSLETKVTFLVEYKIIKRFEKIPCSEWEFSAQPSNSEGQELYDAIDILKSKVRLHQCTFRWNSYSDGTFGKKLNYPFTIIRVVHEDEDLFLDVDGKTFLKENVLYGGAPFSIWLSGTPLHQNTDLVSLFYKADNAVRSMKGALSSELINNLIGRINSFRFLFLKDIHKPNREVTGMEIKSASSSLAFLSQILENVAKKLDIYIAPKSYSRVLTSSDSSAYIAKIPSGITISRPTFGQKHICLQQPDIQDMFLLDISAEVIIRFLPSQLSFKLETASLLCSRYQTCRTDIFAVCPDQNDRAGVCFGVQMELINGMLHGRIYPSISRGFSSSESVFIGISCQEHSCALSNRIAEMKFFNSENGDVQSLNFVRLNMNVSPYDASIQGLSVEQWLPLARQCSFGLRTAHSSQQFWMDISSARAGKKQLSGDASTPKDKNINFDMIITSCNDRCNTREVTVKSDIDMTVEKLSSTLNRWWENSFGYGPKQTLVSIIPFAPRLEKHDSFVLSEQSLEGIVRQEINIYMNKLKVSGCPIDFVGELGKILTDKVDHRGWSTLDIDLTMERNRVLVMLLRYIPSIFSCATEKRISTLLENVFAKKGEEEKVYIAKELESLEVLTSFEESISSFEESVDNINGFPIVLEVNRDRHFLVVLNRFALSRKFENEIGMVKFCLKVMFNSSDAFLASRYSLAAMECPTSLEPQSSLHFFEITYRTTAGHITVTIKECERDSECENREKTIPLDSYRHFIPGAILETCLPFDASQEQEMFSLMGGNYSINNFIIHRSELMSVCGPFGSEVGIHSVSYEDAFLETTQSYSARNIFEELPVIPADPERFCHSMGSLRGSAASEYTPAILDVAYEETTPVASSNIPSCRLYRTAGVVYSGFLRKRSGSTLRLYLCGSWSIKSRKKNSLSSDATHNSHDSTCLCSAADFSEFKKITYGMQPACDLSYDQSKVSHEELYGFSIETNDGDVIGPKQVVTSSTSSSPSPSNFNQIERASLGSMQSFQRSAITSECSVECHSMENCYAFEVDHKAGRCTFVTGLSDGLVLNRNPSSSAIVSICPDNHSRSNCICRDFKRVNLSENEMKVTCRQCENTHVRVFPGYRIVGAGTPEQSDASAPTLVEELSGKVTALNLNDCLQRCTGDCSAVTFYGDSLSPNEYNCLLHVSLTRLKKAPSGKSSGLISAVKQCTPGCSSMGLACVCDSLALLRDGRFTCDREYTTIFSNWSERLLGKFVVYKKYEHTVSVVRKGIKSEDTCEALCLRVGVGRSFSFSQNSNSDTSMLSLLNGCLAYNYDKRNGFCELFSAIDKVGFFEPASVEGPNSIFRFVMCAEGSFPPLDSCIDSSRLRISPGMEVSLVSNERRNRCSNLEFSLVPFEVIAVNSDLLPNANLPHLWGPVSDDIAEDDDETVTFGEDISNITDTSSLTECKYACLSAWYCVGFSYEKGECRFVSPALAAFLLSKSSINPTDFSSRLKYVDKSHLYLSVCDDYGLPTCEPRVDGCLPRSAFNCSTPDSRSFSTTYANVRIISNKPLHESGTNDTDLVMSIGSKVIPYSEVQPSQDKVNGNFYFLTEGKDTLTYRKCNPLCDDDKPCLEPSVRLELHSQITRSKPCPSGVQIKIFRGLKLAQKSQESIVLTYEQCRSSVVGNMAVVGALFEYPNDILSFSNEIEKDVVRFETGSAKEKLEYIDRKKVKGKCYLYLVSDIHSFSNSHFAPDVETSMLWEPMKDSGFSRLLLPVMTDVSCNPFTVGAWSHSSIQNLANEYDRLNLECRLGSVLPLPSITIPTSHLRLVGEKRGCYIACVENRNCYGYKTNPIQLKNLWVCVLAVADSIKDLETYSLENGFGFEADSHDFLFLTCSSSCDSSQGSVEVACVCNQERVSGNEQRHAMETSAKSMVNDRHIICNASFKYRFDAPCEVSSKGNGVIEYWHFSVSSGLYTCSYEACSEKRGEVVQIVGSHNVCTSARVCLNSNLNYFFRSMSGLPVCSASPVDNPLSGLLKTDSAISNKSGICLYPSEEGEQKDIENHFLKNGCDILSPHACFKTSASSSWFPLPDFPVSGDRKTCLELKLGRDSYCLEDLCGGFKYSFLESYRASVTEQLTTLKYHSDRVCNFNAYINDDGLCESISSENRLIFRYSFSLSRCTSLLANSFCRFASSVGVDLVPEAKICSSMCSGNSLMYIQNNFPTCVSACPDGTHEVIRGDESSASRICVDNCKKATQYSRDLYGLSDDTYAEIEFWRGDTVNITKKYVSKDDANDDMFVEPCRVCAGVCEKGLSFVLIDNNPEKGTKESYVCIPNHVIGRFSVSLIQYEAVKCPEESSLNFTSVNIKGAESFRVQQKGFTQYPMDVNAVFLSDICRVLLQRFEPSLLSAIETTFSKSFTPWSYGQDLGQEGMTKLMYVFALQSILHQSQPNNMDEFLQLFIPRMNIVEGTVRLINTYRHLYADVGRFRTFYDRQSPSNVDLKRLGNMILISPLDVLFIFLSNGRRVLVANPVNNSLEFREASDASVSSGMPVSPLLMLFHTPISYFASLSSLSSELSEKANTNSCAFQSPEMSLLPRIYVHNSNLFVHPDLNISTSGATFRYSFVFKDHPVTGESETDVVFKARFQYPEYLGDSITKAPCLFSEGKCVNGKDSAKCVSFKNSTGLGHIRSCVYCEMGKNLILHPLCRKNEVDDRFEGAFVPECEVGYGGNRCLECFTGFAKVQGTNQCTKRIQGCLQYSAMNKCGKCDYVYKASANSNGKCDCQTDLVNFESTCVRPIEGCKKPIYSPYKYESFSKALVEARCAECAKDRIPFFIQAVLENDVFVLSSRQPIGRNASESVLCLEDTKYNKKCEPFSPNDEMTVPANSMLMRISPKNDSYGLSKWNALECFSPIPGCIEYDPTNPYACKTCQSATSLGCPDCKISPSEDKATCAVQLPNCENDKIASTRDGLVAGCVSCSKVATATTAYHGDNPIAVLDTTDNVLFGKCSLVDFSGKISGCQEFNVSKPIDNPICQKCFEAFQLHDNTCVCKRRNDVMVDGMNILGKYVATCSFKIPNCKQYTQLALRNPEKTGELVRDPICNSCEEGFSGVRLLGYKELDKSGYDRRGWLVYYGLFNENGGKFRAPYHTCYKPENFATFNKFETHRYLTLTVTMGTSSNPNLRTGDSESVSNMDQFISAFQSSGFKTACPYNNQFLLRSAQIRRNSTSNAFYVSTDFSFSCFEIIENCEKVISPIDIIDSLPKYVVDRWDSRWMEPFCTRCKYGYSGAYLITSRQLDDRGTRRTYDVVKKTLEPSRYCLDDKKIAQKISQVFPGARIDCEYYAYPIKNVSEDDKDRYEVMHYQESVNAYIAEEMKTVPCSCPKRLKYIYKTELTISRSEPYLENSVPIRVGDKIVCKPAIPACSEYALEISRGERESNYCKKCVPHYGSVVGIRENSSGGEYSLTYPGPYNHVYPSGGKMYTDYYGKLFAMCFSQANFAGTTSLNNCLGSEKSLKTENMATGIESNRMGCLDFTFNLMGTSTYALDTKTLACTNGAAVSSRTKQVYYDTTLLGSETVHYCPQGNSDS